MPARTNQQIIRDIYTKGFKENPIYDSQDMIDFVGIDPFSDLNNNCFIGVNVKTDTREPINPISYLYQDHTQTHSYTPDPSKITGQLPNLLKKTQFSEMVFKWSFNGIAKFLPPKNDLDIEQEAQKFFKTKYDADKTEQNTYNFLGYITEYGLKLSQSQSCWVWIFNVDYDSSNNGDHLSIILAISNCEQDIENIRRKKMDFVNYVLLIKSIYIRKLDNMRLEEATKAAKAAIMSRNMSHNIGSHVMSYLKQHLGSVKDIVTDGILADLVVGENEMKKKLDNDSESTTLPFLMGMGHFISYLQERQDFIATIATDYIPYFASVNFKDGIYDELNPDLRALRHSERKNGKTDNILLGNIARSEGLGRNTAPTILEKKTGRSQLNDIVLRFRTCFNGYPVKNIDPEYSQRLAELQKSNDKYKNHSTLKLTQEAEDHRKTAEQELEEMRQYDFSLPGGITGRQAFFSIMENIIRNAAKHGNWREKRKLELTFDIFTNDKDEIDKIPDNDNMEGCKSLQKVLKDYYFHATDANDLYFVTITDNCDFSLKALGKLRMGLKEDYINMFGTMTEGNKGLKEIRISAAWLRGIHNEKECVLPYPDNTEKDEDLQLDGQWLPNTNSPFQAPIVYARLHNPKDATFGIPLGEHLQYIICLPIPKKIAIISSCFSICEKSTGEISEINTIRKNAIKINWRIFTEDDFIKEKNKSFEFILCDDVNDSEIHNRIRPIATDRVFRMSQIGIDTEDKRNNILNELKKQDPPKSELIKGLSYVLMRLYKLLSKYDNETITIDEHELPDLYNKDKEKFALKSNNILIVDGKLKEYTKYVYRRHHESEEEFKDYMTNDIKCLFTEGITGSNSTDRLVCHENLDDAWFYRHLHAMKQYVAIFDERLFAKITGLEESSFVKKLENGEIIDNMDSEVFSKNHSALVNTQKNVYFFNFIKDPFDTKVFNLMGVYFINGKPKINEQYQCSCKRLAKLSFSNESGLSIENMNGSDHIMGIFDYVTIHQGLLDKLYESFGIKGSLTEKADKIRLTTDLFSNFCNRTAITNNDTKEDFLPGLIIHSGRSKPAEDDMPQKLPFIQYAALEHAALDCKYSLVELLDYARYEK